MTSATPKVKSPGMQIFRASEAPRNYDSTMTSEPLSDVASAGSQRLIEAGVEDGHENRVLFVGGGFSLVYAWFKSGYPLPRHTHNETCLYYIVGGSLQLGNEELRAGDGFLLGHDVPYTYTPGPEGVEIIEFRACETFNIDVLANNPAFWDSAVKTVEQNREKWRDEKKPSGLC